MNNISTQHYKPLMQVKGSRSNPVRPKFRGSKGKDTRKKGKMVTIKKYPKTATRKACVVKHVNFFKSCKKWKFYAGNS